MNQLEDFVDKTLGEENSADSASAEIKSSIGLARKSDEYFVIDNSSERNILNNINLVFYIINEKFKNLHYKEDLISEGKIGLIKAVNTFDKAKNTKFSSYAYRCILNQILMYIRKEKKFVNVSFEDTYWRDSRGNQLTYEEVLGTEADIVSREIEIQSQVKQVLHLFKNITPLERKVLTIKYGLDGGETKTQRQVAEELGFSRSYISRVEKSAILKLRKYLNIKPSTLEVKSKRVEK